MLPCIWALWELDPGGSSVATISGPPANKLFGPLAKGLRRLLLPGGPLQPRGPPRSRGLQQGPRYATACQVVLKQENLERKGIFKIYIFNHHQTIWKINFYQSSRSWMKWKEGSQDIPPLQLEAQDSSVVMGAGWGKTLPFSEVGKILAL